MIVTIITYILQVLTALVATFALITGIAMLSLDGNIARAMFQFVFVAINVGLFFAQGLIRKEWKRS